MPKVHIVDPKVERKARKIQIPDISLNRYRTKLERETERYGKTAMLEILDDRAGSQRGKP